MTPVHRPRPKTGINYAILSLIVIIAGVLVLSRTAARHLPEQRSPLTGVGDLDPDARPIYDSTDAISRTIELLPQTLMLVAKEARLMSREHLAALWFKDLDPSGTPQSAWLPQSPIWLVGIKATGGHVNDFLILPGGGKVADSRSVEGGFAVWDANSGVLATSGALMSGSINTFQALTSLSSETLQIQHATAEPVPMP